MNYSIKAIFITLLLTAATPTHAFSVKEKISNFRKFASKKWNNLTPRQKLATKIGGGMIVATSAGYIAWKISQKKHHQLIPLNAHLQQDQMSLNRL